MIDSAEKSHAYHQPQPAVSSEGPSTASPASEEGASQTDTSLLQTVSEYVGLKGIAAGILVLVVIWKIFEVCKRGDTSKKSLYGVCCNMFAQQSWGSPPLVLLSLPHLNIKDLQPPLLHL